MPADFQSQLGEAFVGQGGDAAHINSVLGSKGGAVETAWVTALATPTAGHVPFVAVVQPNLPARPFTLFVNKATISGERHAELTWGPAQAGVACGVVDAVADGLIAPLLVDELLILAAVWVNPEADDADAVFANNRQAMRAALEAGRHRQPSLDDVLAARNDPSNPYFRSG